MSCVKCQTRFFLNYSSGWACPHCYGKEQAQKVETALLASQAEELQSKLTFLSLQLDNEKATGILKADVAILIQDRTDEILHAHKFVLASKSSVFCKMFEINMLESETGVVRIADATVPVMRAVIGFCYTAEIKFTDEVTPEEVFEMGHKYSIDLLVNTCVDRLIQTLDNVNLPQRLKAARKFQNKKLAAGALEYFKTHYEEVVAAVIADMF